MESLGGAGVQLSMDCEDMFKEITKKLYGEEGALEYGAGGGAGAGVGGDEGPAALAGGAGDTDLRPEEHITAFGLAALMQNGFPPPGILQANFAPRLDPAHEDRWTGAEEPLAWAGSRVAAYNPAQRLFKCAECDCVGFLSRVAEHWLGTHSNARVFTCPQCAYGSSWARCLRAHLARDHALPPHAHDHALNDNPALNDITRYLQRLKARVDARKLPPPSPATVTATTAVAGAPPSAPGPGTGAPPAPAPGPAPAAAAAQPGAVNKRYACPACPYATDRRDLYTRHENIHRDEKPFECYVCQKQFNRADHVKKHFLRMHRDHAYDLNRIRRCRSPGPSSPTPAPAPSLHPAATAPAQHDGAGAEGAAGAGAGARGAAAAGAARRGERRYACCYCAWAGSDNWCLKRHLNTHLKPFACALCEYRAARAERLATHLQRVHNKRACARCAFLADSAHHLHQHTQAAHHAGAGSGGPAAPPVRPALRVPAPQPPALLPVTPPARAPTPAPAPAPAPPPVPTHAGSGAAQTHAQAQAQAEAIKRRTHRQHGAARLFSYLEASDDEVEGAGGAGAGAGTEYAPPYAHDAPRDKENAAPPDCLVRF